MKKYVYIGFGVATTYSVIKLLDAGIKGSDILIIEKGDDIFKRKREDIMSGEGGCGTWSDLKYVYSLTRGGTLVEYTGEEKALELLEQVRTISHRFHPAPDNINHYSIKEAPNFIKESNLDLIQSEAEHLGTRYAQDIGIKIHQYFEDKGVIMYFKTEVTSVDFKNNSIGLMNDNDYHRQKISYKYLVIAMGKSGIRFMDKIINEYGLWTKPKAAQIGVRFESEQKYFQRLLDFTYDFKLYRKYNDVLSLRTFCVNSNNCHVAIENTYGDVSFNGHSIGDGFNGKVNFGVIMELKGIDNPFEYTRGVVKKNNIDGKGVTYSPSNKIATADGISAGHYFLDSNMPYFSYIEDFIDRLNNIFHFGDDYILYAPEVKYLNNQLLVNNSNLSLKQYVNVFCAGDVLSARGITVSAAQGLFISEHFIKEHRREGVQEALKKYNIYPI